MPRAARYRQLAPAASPRLQGRNAAIQHLLREAAEAGRPVLVGTGSVQESADVLRSVVQPFVE